MAEYIKREAAIDAVTAVYVRTAGYKTRERVWETREAIQKLPAADVAPVVRCKDCEYSYDEISYLCCSHGVCVDCEVPPNFYCAEGKRKENDE